ncbi:MAG: hypothetical protein AAF889_05290 [Cyanobacteria bacterium P01_D01_bin.73]
MLPGFTRFAATAAIIGLVTACGGAPETTEPEPSPSVTEEGGAAAPDGTEAPAAADFDAPLVPGDPEAEVASGDPPPVRVARLIAPTNPDVRARQTEAELKKNKATATRDPFSIPINVSPSVAAPTSSDDIAAGRARAAAEGASAGTGPIAIPRQVPPVVTAPPSPPPTPSTPSASSPSSGSSPGSSSSGGSSGTASGTAEPAVPAGPPAPSGAQGVRVTGVVQIGNDYKIVVEVPGERTARYVSVGDRLTGDVLVKRVELDDLLDPIVVLEQYGQEVLKPVGEEPSNRVAIAPNTESRSPF